MVDFIINFQMTEKKGHEKLLLSGNEAIALGAYEASVKVAAAYPGTPSTEILQTLTQYEDIYTEWSVNEKVALEVALGASIAGVRAMASMKHVGLNVAADPLFTAAYTGVRGGLVIITADDPEMHSSQNAQDNRNYAAFAKVPMLEPSDPQEAKEFTKMAFSISESFDIPVIVRTTTRLSHVSGIVRPGRRQRPKIKPSIEKTPQKFVMLPVHARQRRIDLEDRLKKLKEFSERFKGHKLHRGSREIGIITSGVSYNYVMEVMPEATVLKLGLIYPLPEGLIKKFASMVKKLYVVEELDPYLEIQIKAMGIDCRGKDIIPPYGEIDPYKVRLALTGQNRQTFPSVEVPKRPPVLCPGCPHRGVFYAISKTAAFVSGDIGCYTLAALPPLKAMDTCVCMGASLGMAFGMEKALGRKATGKVLSVIGESTFLHSGITHIVNMLYNKSTSTVVILDNRVTAMTGHQPNPVTGITAKGEPTQELDLEALLKGIGVKHVYTVNPHDIETTQMVITRELKRKDLSVVISKAPCALLPEVRKSRRPPFEVLSEECRGCRACLKIGCPAIWWVSEDKRKGRAEIQAYLCNGCGECEALCKFGAIRIKDEGQ